MSVTFVPHLLPVNRGILSTIYARMKPGVTLGQVREAYAAAYAGERFVRLLPEGEGVNIRQRPLLQLLRHPALCRPPYRPADRHLGDR